MISGKPEQDIEMLTKKRCSREVRLHAYSNLFKIMSESLLNVSYGSVSEFIQIGDHQQIAPDAAFLYFYNPLSNKSIFEGTMYLSTLKRMIKNLNSEYPLLPQTIKSRYSMTLAGDPMDITYIYNSIRECLRVSLIRTTLRSTCETLRNFEAGFVDNLALLSRELFNWDNTGKYDLLVEPAEFIKIAEQLGDLLIILYSYSFIRNPLYQNTFELFRTKRNSILPYDRYTGMNSRLMEIDNAALEITCYVDKYLISSPSSNSAQLPSLNLNSNSGFSMQRLSQNIPYDTLMNFSVFEEMENILGYNLKFRFYIPAVIQNKFNHVTKVRKKYINSLCNNLIRIRSENCSTITRLFEQSGEIDIDNIHRREADGLIFKDELKKIKLRSKFNMVFLIDNSCSINDTKKGTMQQILSLLLMTINSFPELFEKVIAYAQNTDGPGTVALRKLIDEKAGEIRNLGKVMHINQAGINYDIFALYKIIKIHLKDLSAPKITNIIILVGDAWPIGVAGDVIAEQKKVINYLRSAYKNLIIIYIATDPNRHPRDLSYDYFLSQQSSEFSMDIFISQFSYTISQILKQHI